MGDWYKDKKRQTYIATYEDQKKMQKEVEAAIKHGWEIKDTTSTGGHVHLGRSLALGGVNWLVGKGRSKDKVTITFGRVAKESPRIEVIAPQSFTEEEDDFEGADSSDEQAAPVAPELELIKKLAELRDAGVLSSEEFETKKAELLARL